MLSNVSNEYYRLSLLIYFFYGEVEIDCFVTDNSIDQSRCPKAGMIHQEGLSWYLALVRLRFENIELESSHG